MIKYYLRNMNQFFQLLGEEFDSVEGKVSESKQKICSRYMSRLFHFIYLDSNTKLNTGMVQVTKYYPLVFLATWLKIEFPFAKSEEKYLYGAPQMDSDYIPYDNLRKCRKNVRISSKCVSFWEFLWWVFILKDMKNMHLHNCTKKSF